MMTTLDQLDLNKRYTYANYLSWKLDRSHQIYFKGNPRAFIELFFLHLLCVV